MKLNLSVKPENGDWEMGFNVDVPTKYANVGAVAFKVLQTVSEAVIKVKEELKKEDGGN